jgi:hypothetical protein
MAQVKQHQTGELIGLIVWPVVAAALAFWFHAIPIISIFLFYGPPCLYLCFKKPAHIPKAAIFAIVWGVPTMFVYDYIAHLTGTWYLYNTLPRILTYVAIEDVVFMVAWIFFTIMFYEHFLHHRMGEKIWNPRMKYAVIFLIIFLVVFAICVVNFPQALYIPYFYLILGCVAVLIPILIEAFDYPRILFTFFGTAAYFFIFTLYMN